jgi:type III secretion system chaperone SycN
MDWIQSAINDFGNSIGLPGLRLDDDGSLRLRTGSGGSIELHHLSQDDEGALVIAYGEPAPYDLAERLRRALQHADLRRNQATPLQVASYAAQLILATRLPERLVSQPVLNETLAWLRDLHETLRHS